MKKKFHRSPDAAAPPAPAASAAPDKVEYASKQDFDTLQKQSAEFIDLVTQTFLNKETPMRDTNPPAAAPAAAHPVASSVTLSADEIAAAGFDDKQVAFVQNLVQKVASNTAETVFTKAATESFSQTKAKEYDKEAYTDYPDLNNKSSELYKLTDSICKEQMAIDSNSNKRPDFVLAATMRADKILKKQAAAKNNSPIVETHRRQFDAFSLDVGSHSGGIPPKDRDENISEERKTIRNLLR